MKNNHRFFSAVFTSLIICAHLFSQTSGKNTFKIEIQHLPEIETLSSRDYVFRQFLNVVEENDRNLAQKKELLVEFYSYTVKKSDSLFTIAAATGIPYDTIVSLNRISSISESISGKTLIIPAIKGLFLRKNPKKTVEIMNYVENENLLEIPANSCYNLLDSEFIFIPGKRFSSTSRAYFLDSTMRMPLDQIRITSEYGMRVSPVSGTWKFHKGVDFACPDGTEVHACKAGSVEYAEHNNEIFGNYIILRHSGDMTSVYAHLSKINVRQGDSVSTGKVIGLSGKTGKATGPHLHFEIRKNGKAQNPLEIIR